jgi:serine/threonine protein phosphatase PrpC
MMNETIQTEKALIPEIWGDSDRGKVRQSNEDNIYYPAYPRAGGHRVDSKFQDIRGRLMAVADGVAGQPGGKEASTSLIEELVRAYYWSEINGTFDPLPHLQWAVHTANAEAFKRRRTATGSTTLVAAVIRRGRLYVINVGDSRAYLLRAGQLQPLTQDHSQNGNLTRSMVAGAAVQLDVHLPIILQPGDRVLLCSDGLHEVVEQAELAAVAASSGSAEQIGRRLIDLANSKGGPDNISVVLARYGSGKAALWGITNRQLVALAVMAAVILLAVILLSNWALGNTDTPTLVPPINTIPAGATLAPTDTILAPTTTPEPAAATLPPTLENNLSSTSATSTRQPTATPTHTPTWTPPPTATLTPLPTLIPTDTPPPTNTPMPTNTAEPIPAATDTPPPTPE